MKIYLDSQEQELLLRLYDNISLQLCLDIPPTKSLKDKKLIEVASVCNETINGKSNYFYFKLSDSCRYSIKKNERIFDNDFLELEEIKEEMSFQQHEKTNLLPNVYNFYGNTNFTGGNVENQLNNIGEGNMFNLNDIANKLEEIEQEIPSFDLDNTTESDLRDLIKEAKKKIKEKRSPGIIKTALKSICDFVISTASGIAAAVITAKLNGSF